MKSDEMVIITDTREQKALRFPDHQNEVGTLKTGDYSVKGFEDQITFEHKSIKDIISTVSRNKPKGAKHSNRERFELELQRMKDGFDFYCIVISGSESDILPACKEIYKTQWREYMNKCRIAKIKGFKPPRKPMRPECRAPGVIGSLKAFRMDYNCHFYFLRDKENAAAWIAQQSEYFVRHK